MHDSSEVVHLVLDAFNEQASIGAFPSHIFRNIVSVSPFGSSFIPLERHTIQVSSEIYFIMVLKQCGLLVSAFRVCLRRCSLRIYQYLPVNTCLHLPMTTDHHIV